MIAQQLGAATGALHLHGLVQIEVEETGTAVAQHALHELQGVGLQTVGLLGAPCHPHGLGLLADNCSILRLCQCRQ